jgi:hypothetical protein
VSEAKAQIKKNKKDLAEKLLSPPHLRINLPVVLVLKYKNRDHIITNVCCRILTLFSVGWNKNNPRNTLHRLPKYNHYS